MSRGAIARTRASVGLALVKLLGCTVVTVVSVEVHVSHARIKYVGIERLLLYNLACTTVLLQPSDLPNRSVAQAAPMHMAISSRSRREEELQVSTKA